MLLIELAAQIGQLVDQGGAFGFGLADAALVGVDGGAVRLGEQIYQLADFLSGAVELLFQSGNSAAVDRFFNQIAQCGRNVVDHKVRFQTLHQMLEHGVVDAARHNSLALAEPIQRRVVLRVPFAMPWLASLVDQEPGQQVGAICVARAALLLPVQLFQDRFGLGRLDQRRVRVFGDEPFLARPALGAAAITLGQAFVVDIPHGMSCVGQGLPFHRVQAGHWPINPESIDQHSARLAGGACFQVGADNAGIFAWHQF